MQGADRYVAEAANGDCGQPFSTTLDVVGLFLVSEPDSVVSDTGATADLLGLRWLEHHKRISRRAGYQQVTTYPASARFSPGDGRLGKARHAADIPVGTVERKGKSTACVLDPDIPALSRQGPAEPLGGQLDFSRDISTLRKQGVRTPLRLNPVGRCIPSVVDSGKDQQRRPKGPTVSSSYFERASTNKRPDSSSGGLRLPHAEDGPYQFEPLRTPPACKATTLWDATDGCTSDPKKTITQLHDNWGHVSAQRLTQTSVDSDGANMHLAPHMDEVFFKQCAVRRAFDEAPHVPIAGTPTVSMFTEKLRVDLFFFRRSYCPECDGCSLQVLPFDTRQFEEPSASVACLLQFADWGCRPAFGHPHG